MPIAFDATANFRGTFTSGTYSHTCTGNNRLLVAAVYTGAGTSDIITGVTYAGSAMTRIGFINQNGGLLLAQWMYYLVGPTSGANNIVVSSSDSVDLRNVSVSYTGVQQTGQPDASGSNSIAAGSITMTLTTIANNTWMVTSASNNQGAGTIFSGGIPRGTSDTLVLGDSNADITPAGAYNIIWNRVGVANWLGIKASFVPVAAGISGYKSLLGVGA